MDVNILGVNYNLVEKSDDEDKALKEIDGYCDSSARECVIDAMKDSDPRTKKNISFYKDQVKRHEIIHGFLYESGLETCCDWACEEMVDWLSIQFPKIRKAFEEAGCS